MPPSTRINVHSSREEWEEWLKRTRLGTHGEVAVWYAFGADASAAGVVADFDALLQCFAVHDELVAVAV